MRTHLPTVCFVLFRVVLGVGSVGAGRALARPWGKSTVSADGDKKHERLANSFLGSKLVFGWPTHRQRSGGCSGTRLVCSVFSTKQARAPFQRISASSLRGCYTLVVVVTPVYVRTIPCPLATNHLDASSAGLFLIRTGFW